MFFIFNVCSIRQRKSPLGYLFRMFIQNKKINLKFKNLLLDDGLKRIYLPSVEEQEDLYNFNNKDIEKSIKESNLNKATSWDINQVKYLKNLY